MFLSFILFHLRRKFSLHTRENGVSNSLKLEPVQSCPVCGSNGYVRLEGCRDHICGLSGNWSFRKCQQCDSLWIDPRPTKEMISYLYPDNYCFTHTQPEAPLKEPEGFFNKLRFSAKLAILEHKFGYKGLSQQASLSLGIKLGKFIRFLPGIPKWAGYTVRFLPYYPQGRLLEVGAGNGQFLWLMNELGWHVEGIEPDPKAAQAAAVTGLKLIKCGVEDVDLEPSSYDAIVLHHVLEHLPDPKTVLKKLEYSLKPGGVLVSISPNPVGIIASCFKNNWYELDAPRHFILPSRKGYEFMLEGTKFQVKVYTILQIFFWICRESLSIHQTGIVGKYTGWLVPKILGLFTSILLPFFPDLGEEVVCYAVKE
jgi:2-polyprenyl-3-methyl-5-hydroxy-6-metoxy-1,4-benzoquinol methylase